MNRLGRRQAEQYLVYNLFSRAIKSPAAASTAYAAVHETQLDDPPDGLLKDFAGLAALQPVRAQNGKLHFIAFWSSSDHALAGEPSLKRRLGNSVVTVSGIAYGLITKAPSTWEKVKGQAVPILLTTVAVLGALDILNNRYDGLIAAPQYTLRLNNQEYDVEEGGTLTSVLTVENALPNVQLTDIHIEPKLSPVQDVAIVEPFKLVDAQGTSLPATKARSYQLLAEGLKSGERQLTVSVRANAGMFRSPHVETATARLVVWPKAPQAGIALRQIREKENRADFLWTLRVGQIEPSSEVVCDLIFRGGKFSVSPGYWRPIDGASNEDWLPADDMARLRVSWPAVKARSRQLAEFSVVGPSGLDWNEVAKVKPTCAVVRKS